MDYNIDNLKNLFDQLKNISFFKRLFGWKKINNLLFDASADIQKLISAKDSLHQQNSEINNQLNEIKSKLNRAEQDLGKLNEANIKLIAEEERRKVEYVSQITALNKLHEQIRQDRLKEIEDKNNSALEQLKKQKETWNRHEESVKARMKAICSKHNIEYVEKVPFKGEPDNTVKICDEFIIFDAKSPLNDDLSNFPFYLKDQAERAKKYARQENVKTDIFFVVPSNALESLPQFVFGMVDYNIYITSIDVLEPVLLALKKIENYEFADQLSPEERENICRIIGKFAHLSKRKIEIDGYFATQLIELLNKCESDLPKDIMKKSSEFEKESKINPPQEKRAKIVNIKDLEIDIKKLSSLSNKN